MAGVACRYSIVMRQADEMVTSWHYKA